MGRVLLFRAGRDGDSGPTFTEYGCCCRAARCTGVGARPAIRLYVSFVDQFAFGLMAKVLPRHPRHHLAPLRSGVRTNGYNPPEMNVIMATGRAETENG